MSRDKQYLLDILDSAKIALSHVLGLSWDDFCNDAIDLSIIWDTIHNNLPPLIADLEKNYRFENFNYWSPICNCGVKFYPGLISTN
jgi:uncharacterized protein with HEPN domain